MIGLLANHGHWKTTTFVGGLTSRGFVAPYVLDGAIDGPTFKAWTEQMPAPQLEPGDIVSMDNLAAHKVQGVRQAIEARGAELRYLATLFTRPEPDRASLCQAQGASEKGRRTHRRRPMEHDRQAARLLLACRMPKLYRKHRPCTVTLKTL